MHIEPNRERQAKLKVSEEDLYKSILFCPKCPFQLIGGAMKPICPDCKTHLHITIATKELIEHIKSDQQEQLNEYM